MTRTNYLPVTHGLSDTLECNRFEYFFSVFFILCVYGIITNLTVFISTKLWFTSYNLSVNNYMWHSFSFRNFTAAMWNCYVIIFLWNNLEYFQLKTLLRFYTYVNLWQVLTRRRTLCKHGLDWGTPKCSHFFEVLKMLSLQTRKHSSRMRTTCLLTVSYSIPGHPRHTHCGGWGGGGYVQSNWTDA